MLKEHRGCPTNNSGGKKKFPYVQKKLSVYILIMYLNQIIDSFVICFSLLSKYVPSFHLYTKIYLILTAL